MSETSGIGLGHDPLTPPCLQFSEKNKEGYYPVPATTQRGDTTKSGIIGVE